MKRFYEVFRHIDGEAAEIAKRGETGLLLVCIFNFAQEMVTNNYDVGDILHRSNSLMEAANYHRKLNPEALLCQAAIDIPGAIAALKDWVKS